MTQATTQKANTVNLQASLDTKLLTRHLAAHRVKHSSLNFEGLVFEDQVVSKAVLESTLELSNFKHCKFVRCTFENINLEASNFEFAEFHSCRFVNCNLSMTQGKGSKWFRCILEKCDWSAARFQGCSMHYLSLKDTNISDLRLDGANVSLSAGLPSLGPRIDSLH